MEEQKFNSLFLGVLNLFLSGRHLHLGSAVDDGHLLRTQSFCRPCSIHGNVATSEDRNLMRIEERGKRFSHRIRLHQVAAGQVLVGRENTYVVLPLNPHELGKAGTRTYEYCIKAITIHQIADLTGLAHQIVALDLNAHLHQIVQLMLHDLLGKTEFRNSVDQYATCFVQGFEHHYLMPFPAQVSCSGDACGTSTHHRHFLASLCLDGRDFFQIMLTGIVSDKTLDTADGNRLVHILEHLAHRAIELTLALLRTDASTDRWQQAALLDDLHRFGIVAFGSLCDEGRNVDGHRTTGDAGLGLALQTAHCLYPDLAVGVSEGDLLHILHPNRALLGRHLLEGNLCAFPCIQGLSSKLAEQLLCLLVQLFLCSVHRLGLPFFDLQSDVTAVMGFLLLAPVSSKAQQHIVPIDLMTIELGAIDTYKLRLSTDGDPASTAHAGSIDHDGVQRHNGMDTEGLGG
ncbi:hypothetical protein SDC9_107146 [bioreactor metagenome]|uniref:Uncharacterized protein n=1 Tax=bioreactor metagenome TaxID=1076179 RepID=A0A645B4F3_9ZZZZ